MRKVNQSFTFDKKFGDILSNFDREWKISRLRNHRKNRFSRFWFFNGEIHFGYFDFIMWFLNFQLVFNFWCWALYHQTFYRMYRSKTMTLIFQILKIIISFHVYRHTFNNWISWRWILRFTQWNQGLIPSYSHLLLIIIISGL